MPRNGRTEKQMRAFAEEHLVYEARMLFAAATELTNGGHPKHITNALLESFAIHLRALIDFLWERDVKPDDALAKDFFETPNQWQEMRPVIPAVFSSVRKRVGKEIAHITYARLHVEPEAKPWPITEMAQEMHAALAIFIDYADAALLGAAPSGLTDGVHG